MTTKEAIALSNKKYYKKHKKRILENNKEYRRKNEDKIKKINKEYYEKLKSENRIMPRKIRYYICEDCKEEKASRAASSFICRSCAGKRGWKKAHKAAIKARRLRDYEALYRSFLRTAAHEIELTYEDFLEYVKIKHCYYCDRELVWHKKSISRGGQGVYARYNLDRKDSNLGYTKANCVTCCPQCNKAKMNNFSAEEFKEIIKLVKKIRGSW